MLLLENSWIGTGCENYRFKNIPSHKDGTNTGPLLNAPWLPEIWSGSEIQTAAVCGEKDSPPLSGGKGVKLLCIKYVLEKSSQGSRLQICLNLESLLPDAAYGTWWTHSSSGTTDGSSATRLDRSHCASYCTALLWSLLLHTAYYYEWNCLIWLKASVFIDEIWCEMTPVHLPAVKLGKM